jgi:hypothetical protein
MGVKDIAFDFMRWIFLGTGAALGIIVLISLGMPRRKAVNARPEKRC